jgi:hypothetical protein
MKKTKKIKGLRTACIKVSKGRCGHLLKTTEGVVLPVGDQEDLTARDKNKGYRFIFSRNFVSLRLEKQWRGSSGG